MKVMLISSSVSINILLSTSEKSSNHKRKFCSCDLFDLHQEQVPYEVAWSWQKEIVKDRKAQIEKEGDCADTLIILQHPSVYTLGTASTEENLKFDMKNAPIHVYCTERGREVTYHGPGQLVMYPIINLRRYKMDLHWYLGLLQRLSFVFFLQHFQFRLLDWMVQLVFGLEIKAGSCWYTGVSLDNISWLSTQCHNRFISL